MTMNSYDTKVSSNWNIVWYYMILKNMYAYVTSCLIRGWSFGAGQVFMTFVGILTVYILESETSNLWYIIQNMSTLNLLKVNTDTGVLLSAGISKTGLYDPTDANSIEQCEEAYKVSLRYHQILFPFRHFAVAKCKKYYIGRDLITFTQLSLLYLIKEML